jgi:hypothetical protein
MKPKCSGIYECFDEFNTKHLVEVFDACKGLTPQYLQVFFNDKCYSVDQEIFGPEEFPNRWGNLVSPF